MMTQTEGGRKIDHLKQVERTTGKNVLPDFEIPVDGQHLWEWFCELNNARGSTGFGLAPLSFSEIGTWAKLMKVEIYPEEVKIIKCVDNAFLEVVNKAK